MFMPKIEPVHPLSILHWISTHSLAICCTALHAQALLYWLYLRQTLLWHVVHAIPRSIASRAALRLCKFVNLVPDNDPRPYELAWQCLLRTDLFVTCLQRQIVLDMEELVNAKGDTLVDPTGSPIDIQQRMEVCVTTWMIEPQINTSRYALWPTNSTYRYSCRMIINQ